MENNHSYIFGKTIGKFMIKIDQRLQYESTLMSMSLIMLGLVLFTIYIDFYTSQTLWFKIMFTFNSICGMGLLGSFLVTQFQAYQSYMVVMDEMKNFNNKTISSLETVQQKMIMKGGLNKHGK